MGPLPRHSGCQTLTGLTLEHLPGVRVSGRTRHYRKGAIIWSIDDSADRIYFLERGGVAVRITDVEGRELTVRVIEAGQPFGELCFCAEQNGRRRTSAIALYDSDATEITHADFLNHLQTSREALTALVITFCLRLSDAEARLGVLAQRLKRAGRHLLERLGRADGLERLPDSLPQALGQLVHGLDQVRAIGRRCPRGGEHLPV